MNVIILHGIPDYEETSETSNIDINEKHWISWLKEELEKRNTRVLNPLMPKAWNPDYEVWKKEFDKLIINKESVLIGHSGGCSFLVRWLGETQQKIKKLILVAPWKIPSNDFPKKENELYDFNINKNLKNNIEEIVIFTSDNDEEDGKKSASIFNKELGGKLIELKYHGHFTEEGMGTEKFPELLEEVLR